MNNVYNIIFNTYIHLKKRIEERFNINNIKKCHFYQHTSCPYFPCHKGVSKEVFNCKFCYCPLYLIPECGGNYIILENGIKDCSYCSIPHTPNGYKYILKVLIRKYLIEGDDNMQGVV